MRVWEGKGRAISEAWFDENDQPMMRNKYAKIEREFDDEGNMIVERYYGLDGEKTPCKYGYDELHRTAEGEETYYLNGEEYYVPGEQVPEEEIIEENSAEKEDAA